MLDISQNIFDNYQVRKTKKQKSKFIDMISSACDEKKIPFHIEQGGMFKSRNIVIGDTKKAKLIVTAHYDTAPELPFPNFLTPNNILLYILYQILIVILIFFICGGLTFLVFLFTNNGYISYCSSLFFLFTLLILIVFGKANIHTANDNTSGVITLTEIIFGETRVDFEKVAFVFFDNEEIGLIGSSLFKKMHKEKMNTKLLINYDCVSDGDNILIVKNKDVWKNKSYTNLFEQAFNTKDKKKIIFAKSSKSFYPSDQIIFPNGVGVAALKKSKLFGLYMDKIHTRKDINFDISNIELLKESTLKLIDLFNKENKKT